MTETLSGDWLLTKQNLAGDYERFAFTCSPMVVVPLVNNKAFPSELGHPKEQLLAYVKCSQVPRVHVQGLYHVFLHKLGHGYVHCKKVSHVVSNGVKRPLCCTLNGDQISPQFPII